METKEHYSKLFANTDKHLREIAFKNKFVKQVIADTKAYSFCPYMQFVRLDALEEKDYPHNIDINSIYITFKVDYSVNKVEVHSCGHVYLSKKDKESERYKYFAMKSMQDILVDNGGKKFRKCKFKDAKDLCEKMLNYFNTVMVEVEKYTEGYPYKEGI